VRVIPRKILSGLLVALAALLFIVPSRESYAQSTSRSFQMALWRSSLDADVPTFFSGDSQPLGRSILIKTDWRDAPISTSDGSIEWWRIVAVLIDEPYLDLAAAGHNPCARQEDFDTWLAEVSAVDAKLAQRAAELRSVAPKARFWLNFSEDEASWMKNGVCGGSSAVDNTVIPLNKSYIDVISLDRYLVAFEPAVKQYYDWFAANRAKSDQQVGLIPGTFYIDGRSANQPGYVLTQASYLQAYFDYANDMNQICNLPLGSRGSTGRFDGCPVWMVMGWLGGNHTQDGVTYIGELDQSSTAISNVWRGQLALPIRSDLVPKATIERTLPPILYILLDN